MRFPGFKAEWKKKNLGDVADIGRGKSKHRPRDAAFLYGGKHPFIQTGDVRSAGLYLDKYTQTYSDAGLKQSKLWDENTLCITIAANIAETAILKIKACFPDSIIGLIPYENEASVLFIKHQFDKFKVDVQKLSQGIAQANLNQEKLSSIQFSFPSLIEQEKIATFLSLIDQRIETQNKIIGEIKSLKNIIIDRLFNQLESRNQSRFSNFASNWKSYSYGDLFEISTKRNTDIVIKNILSASQVYGMVERSEIDIDIKYDKSSIKNYKIVEPGDYIIHLRSFQGGLAFSTKKGICSPAYVILKPKPLLEIGFFQDFFTSISFIKTLKLVTYGIRDGKSINVDEFLTLKVSVPTLEEQQKIISIISLLKEKVNYNIQLVELLKKQKMWLINNLLI